MTQLEQAVLDKFRDFRIVFEALCQARYGTLPTASTSTKGGIIVGGGLSMVGDTLNVTLQAGTDNDADVAELDGKIATLNDSITALDVNLNTALTKIDQLGNDIAFGDTSDIDDLKADVVLIESRLDDFAYQLDNVAANIDSSASEYTLPTASTSTKGGIIVGGGLSMVGDTLNVNLALDTVPATVDGGLWYEVTDNVPALWIRKGNYGYGFDYDRLRFAGDTSRGLVAYLPFTKNLADACGNKWLPVTDNDRNITRKEALNLLAIVDGSLYFDGRTCLVNDSISSSIGALPWTVDFWGNFSSGTGFWGTFNTLYPSGTNQWVGMKWNGGTVAMHFYANDPLGTITVQADTRHHYAMTYDETIVRMFVDGVLSLSLEHQITLGGDFVIGSTANHNEFISGTIDHFRIHKGVALWTENFTPPNAADYL